MTQALDLANRLLTLEFSTAPTQPPGVELLDEGQQRVLTFEAAGQVKGDLSGTIMASITEVHPMPPPAQQGIAIRFMIETKQGRVEGYYTGSIHTLNDGSGARVNGYGQILRVSGAFADLFMAEVFVTSFVPMEDGRGTGENGTMTLSPR